MDGKPQYWLIDCHPGAGSQHPAETTTERDDDQGPTDHYRWDGKQSI